MIKHAINFFKDPVFSGFQKTSDSEMKLSHHLEYQEKTGRAYCGRGRNTTMGGKKLLGDHSPQALLDAIVFLNGIHFALQSGAEHQKLQFDIIHSDNHAPTLMYCENV